MDFANIPLMQAMQMKMKYHSARQAALAENVANVDTPGYMAHDIKEPDFESMLVRSSTASSMTVTNPGHIRTGMGTDGNFALTQRENTYDLNPIGNNVSVEEEMMRVAENQSEYQKVLGIYKKSLDLFKIAIGKGGS